MSTPKDPNKASRAVIIQMGCLCSSHSNKSKKAEVASNILEQVATEPTKPPSTSYGMMYHITHNNRSALVEFDIDKHRSEIVDMAFTSYAEAGICLLDADTLMVVGGLDKVAHKEVKNSLLLNIASRTIQETAALPHARRNLRLVREQMTVYAVGGVRLVHRREGSKKLSVNEYSFNFTRWDKASDKWVELEDMPRGVECPAAIVFDRLLYVMGGCRVEGQAILVSDSIFTFGSSWAEVQVKLPIPLYCMQVIQITSASLMVFGGIRVNEEASRRSFVFRDGVFQDMPALPENTVPVFTSYSKVSGDELFAINEDGVLVTYNLATFSW
eukprot:CAMPEP_0204912850 /NCGR_PEP_ID=MMETSP1397-20131031/10935_1 /ASSEMBLY_ACC=CAM_ASM_000891 /TAXON_ID=49980 /ORGANISM="Climacostomum Climacostomum virens, Strain Stock W-24" /LENGTH=327 /DNA_ID=CAMNT_0052083963 /DNA_START=670 /DNA_END=1650 /DNA_ORIENTATION=+